MNKNYSNQFPVGKNPSEPKAKASTLLYNIEIRIGGALQQTSYLNAPYAVCVHRKYTLGAQGTGLKNIFIVPVA